MDAAFTVTNTILCVYDITKIVSWTGRERNCVSAMNHGALDIEGARDLIDGATVWSWI